MYTFTMQGIDSVFYVLVLIASVIVHEVAHGLVADRYGDPTARFAGRLTLNPLKHIDFFGSIILPLLLIASGTGIVVGWAKPVPYNPDNLQNPKFSIPLVALAGILTNLAIAVLFGLLVRIGFATGLADGAFLEIGSVVVLVNLVLALFNAVPLPPLDGFRFLFSILPVRFRNVEHAMERATLPLLILFIVFAWRFVAPIALGAYSLITGLQL